MNQVSNLANDDLNNKILEFCRRVAGSARVVAVAQVDRYLMTETDRSVIEIMVVIHDFQTRVMSYVKTVNGRPVFVFAVDQWIFERDIERGFLGEAIASKLIFPYLALAGDDYLRKNEVTLKKRLYGRLVLGRIQ